VNEWAKHKHNYIKRYLEATHGVRGKFIRDSGAAYVDLFSGPGKARVASTGEIIDGSPRLAVNIDANPHAELTPAGADLILRQLQGNADYIQGRAKLAAMHPDTADRRGFEATVGSKLDPRAFQFARMTGPQKTEYVKSLSEDDAKSVKAAYNFAHDAGLIK